VLVSAVTSCDDVTSTSQRLDNLTTLICDGMKDKGMYCSISVGETRDSMCCSILAVGETRDSMYCSILAVGETRDSMCCSISVGGTRDSMCCSISVGETRDSMCCSISVGETRDSMCCSILAVEVRHMCCTWSYILHITVSLFQDGILCNSMFCLAALASHTLADTSPVWL